MKTDNIWDAICVGSGITSLAFGAQVVAKDPHAKILVLEKHSVAGGYATLFTRPRRAQAYFDCSMHKISGSRTDGGNFRRLFENLDLGKELDMVEHPDHFQTCLPEKQFSLPNDHKKVKEILLAHFPDEEAGLEQYFDELLIHGKDAYYHYQIMTGSYDVDIKNLRFAHRNLKDITVAEALDARFKDGMLKEILAAATIYVGGFAEDMSYLYYLHVVYATLCQGNAYIKGSAQQLSDVLVARINNSGGQVKTKAEVLRITKLEDALFKVETKKEAFFARKVYVNAAPHHALNKLFDSAPELEAAKERLSVLKPARSTTTLYLVTKQPPQTLGVESSESMIFSHTQEQCMAARSALNETSPEQDYENAFWHTGPMEVTNYHTLNPDGGNVLCVNVLDSVEHWPDRKDPDYKGKKQRAMSVMMARLLKAKPALEGHIVHAELATPRTYYRYTYNEQGSGYGAVVQTKNSAHNFHHFFPYKNVKFLSAWASGSGYEAAFVYAEMMAQKWQSAPQN
ncbi:NAD(P)-binding protein [Pseudoalteromonas sp. OOF1S-7]|uniref:phytoene desaturase family protein n=1 Tax=Pseudoalteromonas sp. OOF1S-7 TaxID=2917757 RepID=UPI001EF409A9|nr:NAD(P)-binding protein [Pseudoalteromonas sp. OOF1S-7]MCG7534484.1 NAD(P)-binding protein [Pseudoalteromonas sp. OOF1S-7]